MIEPNIFFEPVGKNYFIMDGVACDFCKGAILDRAIYKLFHAKKKTKSFLCCRSCASETKKPGEHRMRIVTEAYNLLVVDEIPAGSYPVVIARMGLREAKDLTVFDAVSNALAPADVTIDRTRLAGRESFGGAQIGMDITPLLEQKDKLIGSDKEVVAVLEGKK